MGKLIVASQLNETFNAELARHAGDMEIVTVPAGSPSALPKAAEVFVAAPFRSAGGVLPPSPPPGWPFDLRWIQLISVGIDAYPDWLFQGPVVTSARGSSAVALAEFALASILGAAKRFPDIWIDRAELWAPRPLSIVAGGTLGLLGFGAIGEALAPRAQALGLKVLAVRRSGASILMPGVELVSSVAALFEQSDHLVLAAPATRETVHLIGRDALERAKPGLHLINVARGELISDEALLQALDNGRVSLASLDVTHPEPLPAGHRYYSHPKVRLSPHTSAYTPDTISNIAASFAENLSRFRQGEPLVNVIDVANGY